MSGGWGWAWDGEGGGIIGIGQGVASYYLDIAATGGIDCGSDASVDNLPAGDFTAEEWVYWEDDGSNHYLFQKYVAGADWFLRLMGSTKQLHALVHLSTTTANALAIHGWTSGTWNHAAMTFEVATKTLKVWSNGVLLATHAGAGTYGDDGSATLFAGCRIIGGDTVDAIAWVRISDTIRYTSNFTPIARCSPPETDANTVLLLRLLEGEGATAADSSGNGNDGALTDCTWRTCS